jgi:sugar lactone lactonase YvrE
VRARPLIAIVAALLLVGAAGAAGAAFPDRIELPDGWQPEGIATGRGHDLYVGSIPTGAVLRIDARTGERETVVQPAPGERAAIGLKVDNRERLFVAGGPTGKAFVYDADSGALLAAFQLAPAGAATFVNDVALTREAAYFTDSQRGVLYVVDSDLSGARELPLQGFDLRPGFNLNGIVASPNGRTLVAVQSNEGRLWRIDARTGESEVIDLGGETLANGDGLLLHGRTLYVVQNRINQIAVVRLDPGFESGEVVRTITSGDFAVPSTIARSGNSLYAVNARFGTPPTAETDYWITRVRR